VTSGRASQSLQFPPASPACPHAHASAPTPALTQLPAYVFAALDELKAAARARGHAFTDLGIGSPDQPTPPRWWRCCSAPRPTRRCTATRRSAGVPRFLEAVSAFMAERFGAAIDPTRRWSR
jgi:LL-diaminopimelate aminotransferase